MWMHIVRDLFWYMMLLGVFIVIFGNNPVHRFKAEIEIRTLYAKQLISEGNFVEARNVLKPLYKQRKLEKVYNQLLEESRAQASVSVPKLPNLSEKE